MALTEFQRAVCRLIARHRIASGEGYVAGGTALNTVAAGARVSHDIDLFHDGAEALPAAEAGEAVLNLRGEFFTGRPVVSEMRCHEGRIRGAWPTIK